jgi:SSS family solute:Na+ symporter
VLLRLHVNALDIAILAVYFAVVLAIGVLARRAIVTSEDFLLSGRSLPAWITGLAFVSANLGATEILGMAANGAQYGVSTVQFYWIGAVPAMVFLGLVMMPFYYGAKVRSVPEYLKLRFNDATHQLNAWTFAIASCLIAGVNLYALALVVNALLGWPKWLAILVAAAFVLAYIFLGGLSGAIYNEVLQFFVILAALVPLVVVALKKVGGISGLAHKVTESALGTAGNHAWRGVGVGHPTNPLGDWIGIVFGLGFVLSFGYWTTNFAEVQRALAAKNLLAARRTSLIGAYPKIFIPALTIIPGLVALVTVKGLGKDVPYNDAIPALVGQLLPNGVLGIAIVGLLASFMAGMAANVSSFNTVVTFDLIQPYFRPGRSDAYYLRQSKLWTVVGVGIGVGTAFIASAYSNIMNYIQLLFSIFNAPLFATFIIAMFWKRTTSWAGFWGLLTGILGAWVFHFFTTGLTLFRGPTLWQPFVHFSSDQAPNFYGAIVAFLVDAVVTVAVTLVTQPKPESELRGLVWGLTRTDARPEEVGAGDRGWYRSPALLGTGALVLATGLSLAFI